MAKAVELPIRPRIGALDAGDVNRLVAQLKGQLTGLKARVDVEGSAAAKVQEIAKEAARTRDEFGRFTKQSRDGLDGLVDSGEKVRNSLGAIGGSLSGILKGAGLAALGTGLVAAGKSAVSANAEMEKFQTQIGTLIKGTADFKAKYKNVTDPIQLQAAAAEEAKVRLAELSKFGADTPFELPQIAAAEKTLIGFGLTGQRAMQLTGKSASDLRTIVGDVSAGTGVDFQELSVTIGKFSTGATGEAIARLQEIGAVTKEEMQKAGIEFDKAGALVSPVNEALTAATTIMQQKFGGGMKDLSATFEGQLSTLKDNAGAALRTLGQPLFEALKGSIGKLNEILNSEGVQKAITSIGAALGPLAAIVTDTLGALLPALADLVGPIAQTITTLLGPVTTIVQGVVGSLGQLITGIAVPLGNLLQTVGQTVVTLVTPIVNALLPAFTSLSSAIAPIIALIANLASALVPLVQVALLPVIVNMQVLAKVAAIIIGAIAPLIQMVAEFAAKLVTQLQPVMEAVAQIAGEFAALLADVLAEALTVIVRLVVAVVKGLGNMVAGWLGAKNGADLFQQILSIVGVAVQKVIGLFTGLRAVLGGLREAFGVVKTTISDFIDAVSNLDISAAIKAFAGFGDKVVAAYNRGSAAASKFKTTATSATEAATTPPPETPTTTATTTAVEKKGKAEKSVFEKAKATFEEYRKQQATNDRITAAKREQERIEARRAKTAVDDAINEQERLDALQQQLSKLKELLKVQGDGTIGITFKSKDEESDAKQLLSDLQASIDEQSNRALEARLKVLPVLDEEQLHRLAGDRLKLEIDLGIRNKSDLIDFIAGDVDRLQGQLDTLTQTRLTEIERAREAEVITEEEFQARRSVILANGEEKQVELLNQILTKRKELRDLKYEQETKALEEQQAQAEEIARRSVESQKRFLDNISTLSEKGGSALIAAQKERDLAALDDQRKNELISEQQHVDRKAEIEEAAAKRHAALEARIRGQRLEAERQAALQSLAIQQQSLKEKLALAEKAGKTEEAEGISKQLDGLQKQIDEKGSIISGLAEDLQGNLTETFSNLFAGNEDAVREPFRKTFGVLAGALQRLAAAKITEVLIGSIIGPAGLLGIVATLGLRPLIESAINGLLAPILDGLLSFSTGGRIDSPTLAIIGDGANLGGDNREWVLRDDQLKRIMAEVAMESQAGLREEFRAMRTAFQEFAAAEWRLQGEDIVRSGTRTRRRQSRRVINPK